MRLTSLRVKNYGCLADFELTGIPPLAIFVGANGTGKSTLFDVFQFLRDCLRDDVQVALAHRGGFEALRTLGADGPIEIELSAHQSAQAHEGDSEADIRYHVAFELTSAGADISLESLHLSTAWLVTGPAELTVTRQLQDRETTAEASSTDLTIPDVLLRPNELWLDQPAAVFVTAARGIALGRRDRGGDAHDAPEPLDGTEEDARRFFDLIEGLRAMLRGSYVSSIDPAAAKAASEVARDHRISERGDNLANALRYQTREQGSESLDRALSAARRAVPGLETVEPVETSDGRVGVKYVEAGNTDGIDSRRVSDGTVKMVAYALLLNETTRHPLLCIEEPENYLYPKLLWPLLEEIRGYTERGDAQVLIATHSPQLLDAADPDEVFWLFKTHGQTSVKRASDDAQVVAEHDFGGQLGFMWQSGAFADAHLT